MPTCCLLFQHSLLTLDFLQNGIVSLRRYIDARKKFCNDLEKFVFHKIALSFSMKVPGNDFEQLVFLFGLELPLSSYSTPGIPLCQQRCDVHPIQLCTALGQVQLIFIC